MAREDKFQNQQSITEIESVYLVSKGSGYRKIQTVWRIIFVLRINALPPKFL